MQELENDVCWANEIVITILHASQASNLKQISWLYYRSFETARDWVPNAVKISVPISREELVSIFQFAALIRNVTSPIKLFLKFGLMARTWYPAVLGRALARNGWKRPSNLLCAAFWWCLLSSTRDWRLRWAKYSHKFACVNGSILNLVSI